MSGGLFASCADVLSVCQSIKDDLAQLLDPVTGFAPRLRDLCREQIVELQNSVDVRSSSNEMLSLKLEGDTWALLQAVMPARKTESGPRLIPAQVLATNPYLPPSALAQSIMSASPLLAELLAVREWLHETAPIPPLPEATSGYWRFTKLNIMQNARTGNPSVGGIIQSMDPDAPIREDKALAADDSNHEKILLHALYSYIRAGKLDEAIELCRRVHQPWRAASIRGSQMFQWRAICDVTQDAEDNSDEDDGWEGNRRRTMWKSTCTRAALNTALPFGERLLYAALAPSPQTRNVLGRGCRSWADHLWAQISVVCEERQSEEVTRLGGGYWEGGTAAIDRVQLSGKDADNDEDEWEREAVGALEQLSDIAVEDGPPSDHAFHVSQLQIILDRTEPLLETFAHGLQNGSYDPESSEYAGLTRFFAHLCLFLQMIDIPVPSEAFQVILEAYLQVLEAAGQRDLIALYAGALGEAAAERYAEFLASLELSANYEGRRAALMRARSHGLDTNAVAVLTAERTIALAFKILPSPRGTLPSTTAFQPPASDAEKLLLRSIEWTTFYATTYDTALEQANVILRYLLGIGRVTIAKTLLAMLPDELAGISEPEHHATEYLCYRQFFSLWETLDRLVDSQAMEVHTMSKGTRAAWLKDYTNLIDRAYESLSKLLTSDWLRLEAEQDEDEGRSLDLLRIRQIYIPELITRMQASLLASPSLLSSVSSAPNSDYVYLRRTFDLANIIADARYTIYEDFADSQGSRLAEYLGSLLRALRLGLEHGGSDPFAVLVK